MIVTNKKSKLSLEITWYLIKHAVNNLSTLTVKNKKTKFNSHVIFHYASYPCCSTFVSSISASSSIYTSVHFNLVDTDEQIPSRRNYAESWIRGEQNLIGKKLTRDVSIKEQSKGRMLARAEQCVISQRRTVCRARLVHVAMRYRFYNQGKGSEPYALVSPSAKPSLTPCKLTYISDVTILKYLAVHKNF